MILGQAQRLRRTVVMLQSLASSLQATHYTSTIHIRTCTTLQEKTKALLVSNLMTEIHRRKQSSS